MESVADSSRRRASLPIKVFDAVVLGAICAFGFALTLKTGFRGFYPFDQSIVFDGSYRVASGQIPYRDFVMPFGPVTFWLHALFFKVLGVTYFAYVFGAATVNALAVVASVAAARLLAVPGRLLSYVAGLLTAVWFYPPFGTPWVDQTAFFFAYVAIVLMIAAVETRQAGNSRRNVLLALSGVAAFASILGKQNAGTFMLPIYILVVAAAYLPDRRLALRRAGAFVAGLVGAAAVFLVWLAVASNFANFNHYVIGVASELGKKRLGAFVRNGFGIAKPYFGRRAAPSVNAIVVGSLVVAVLALMVWRRSRRDPGTDSRRPLLAGVVCIYLVFFQHLFMNTTLNQQENAYPFLGLVLAIAAGLAINLIRSRRPEAGQPQVPAAVRKALIAVVWVVVMVAGVFAVRTGIEVGMSRKVHDVFRGDRFDRPLEVAGLEGLRWADPMRMRGFEMFAKDFVELVAYLRQRGENFFVFPDFTILYGVVGVPSPQPLLWFHERVTYPKEGDPKLDRWIVEDLKKNRVGIVVIEQVAWFNTGERLDAFPGLKAYIYGDFERLGQIGTFSIYQRRDLGR